LRKDFLKSLGGNASDLIVFTSSATESNNTVIKGIRFNPGDVILYCKADHASITAPTIHVSENSHIFLKEILLNKEGEIDLDLFKSQLDEKVKLVLLTHVNNQNGIINPILELAQISKDNSSAHIHVDAVQSFSKIIFSVGVNIDSVSFTSHKIGGPKGIAGLYLKYGHKVQPILHGGNQENGMRSSTVAYPLVLGFHKAMALSNMERENSLKRIILFKKLISEKLSRYIPEIQIPFKNSSPYILSFIIPGISSDIMLRHLESSDVYISSSSACSSKISGFSITLAAMNIPEKFHKNFYRISFGPQTNQLDVEKLIHAFLNSWDKLKKISRNN
jgi:cysteine desulfurase